MTEKNQGEAGRAGCADNKILAPQLHNELVAAWSDETVVLLSRKVGQRLKPVRIVRCAFGNRPILHRVRNRTRDGRIKRLPLVNGFAQGLIYLFGQRILHDVIGKDVTAEQLGDFHNLLSFLISCLGIQSIL